MTSWWCACVRRIWTGRSNQMTDRHRRTTMTDTDKLWADQTSMRFGPGRAYGGHGCGEGRPPLPRLLRPLLPTIHRNLLPRLTRQLRLSKSPHRFSIIIVPNKCPQQPTAATLPIQSGFRTSASARNATVLSAALSTVLSRAWAQREPVRASSPPSAGVGGGGEPPPTLAMESSRLSPDWCAANRRFSSSRSRRCTDTDETAVRI